MTTCSCLNYCCASSCPEPVDPTINITEVTQTGSVAPTIEFELTLGTIAGALTVNAQVEGRFNVTVWFEDVATFSGVDTYVPPTTPGAQRFDVITDADGTKEIEIKYSGAVKTWYAYASVGGIICAAPVTVQMGA